MIKAHKADKKGTGYANFWPRFRKYPFPLLSYNYLDALSQALPTLLLIAFQEWKLGCKVFPS